MLRHIAQLPVTVVQHRAALAQLEPLLQCTTLCWGCGHLGSSAEGCIWGCQQMTGGGTTDGSSHKLRLVGILVESTGGRGCRVGPHLPSRASVLAALSSGA